MYLLCHLSNPGPRSQHDDPPSPHPHVMERPPAFTSPVHSSLLFYASLRLSAPLGQQLPCRRREPPVRRQMKQPVDCEEHLVIARRERILIAATRTFVHRGLSELRPACLHRTAPSQISPRRLPSAGKDVRGRQCPALLRLWVR